MEWMLLIYRTLFRSISVFPYFDKLPYRLQTPTDWYSSTEQPGGTLPSTQLYVSRKLQVSISFKRDGKYCRIIYFPGLKNVFILKMRFSWIPKCIHMEINWNLYSLTFEYRVSASIEGKGILSSLRDLWIIWLFQCFLILQHLFEFPILFFSFQNFF